MGSHLPMNILESLDLFVMHIIRKGRVTSLLAEVGSVCLWATHMERKDGSYLTWKPKLILYQETVDFFEAGFPFGQEPVISSSELMTDMLDGDVAADDESDHSEQIINVEFPREEIHDDVRGGGGG